MNFAFFAATLIMTLAAIALVVSPLLRESFKSKRRLGKSRLELNSLKEAHSAGTLDSAHYSEKRAAIGEALLEHIGNQPEHAAPTMYAALAIAILLPLAAFGGYKWIGAAPDLQNPLSAPQVAVPGEAGLEREYAAAETPNDDGPAEADQGQPRQCDVPALGAGGDPASTASACPETSPPHESIPITVKVSLAANLKAKMLPGDTLFVFAKAAQGPPMPLAIARLTAAQLPASVTLTDSMSMMPNLTLSKFSQIVLGARISKSGNAIAQSGDLQTLSAAVSNSRPEPIQLTIDRTVE
jgi:cytochrome c-type biogenesis protein CcmI